jgi:hypothetical protein
MPKWSATRAARARHEPAEEQPFLLFRLETWLAISIVSLVLQLFPALFWGLIYAIDVRNWTWGVWVGVEIAVIVILFALYVWQTSD